MNKAVTIVDMAVTMILNNVDEDAILNRIDILSADCTDEEMEVIRLGLLAATALFAGMRLRGRYYEWRFLRMIKQAA